MNAEMELLRAFYIAWADFHKIKRDSLHRRQQEAAAQGMLDCAHALRIFYQAQHAPKIEVPDNVIAADFDKAAHG